MRGAARLCHRELAFDEIDRDNRIRAGEFGELHDIHADAADPKHNDRLADLHFGVVVDHAGRRGHGAAEQRRELKIVVGPDHRQAIFRYRRRIR